MSELLTVAELAGITLSSVVGGVFLITWVRDVMSKWAQRAQLDAINHAEALSTLSEISAGGQSLVANTTDKTIKPQA